jgi:hypothetical protein
LSSKPAGVVTCALPYWSFDLGIGTMSGIPVPSLGLILP